MVKHIVSWRFLPEVPQEKRLEIAGETDRRLKALKEKAEGVISVEVVCPPLSTSNVDIVLVSEFVSEEALAAYQVHPDHVAIVTSLIKPNTTDRTCCDFRS